VRYNAVARDVMEDLGVPINDLHAFVLPRLDELQRSEDVHFTPEGSQVLGEEVAEVIRRTAGW